MSDAAGEALRESPAFYAAQRRSRMLLALSAVLMITGVLGLERMRFVKERDERRRARAFAASLSAAPSASTPGVR